MRHRERTPQERYALVVTALSPMADVALGTPGHRGFGAAALQIQGKIFAFLSQGTLVVKLPRQRVEALHAVGAGAPFDPGHGRRMKEWISLAPLTDDEWLALAREALAYVTLADTHR